MISSIVSCSLKTGITTDSSGSAGTRCAARWSLEQRSAHAACGRGPADGEQRQPDRRRDEAIERQRPRRDELLEQPHLSRGVLGGAADVRVVHPAEQADRVGVAQRRPDRGRPPSKAARERPLRVAAMMAERGVERAVGRLHRRHEDQHLAARAGATTRGTARSARTSSSMCSSTLTQTMVSKRCCDQLVAIAFLEMADAICSAILGRRRARRGRARRSSGSARCRRARSAISSELQARSCRCRSRLRGRARRCAAGPARRRAPGTASPRSSSRGRRRRTASGSG